MKKIGKNEKMPESKGTSKFYIATAVIAIVCIVIGFFAGSFMAPAPAAVTQTVVKTVEKTNAFYTKKTLTQTYTITYVTIETIIKDTIFTTFKPYMTVYFSPKGGCEDAVINWINRANKSIHIMIYSFTLDSISDALILAHSKGIEILIVFEKEQISKYSEDIKLKEVGINVRYDNNPELMHNKVMIIDNKVVLTGSFNWSSQAENRNNENLLIIIDPDLAEIYEKDFQKIWNESTQE